MKITFYQPVELNYLLFTCILAVYIFRGKKQIGVKFEEFTQKMF